jgi:hypothetical protein
MVVEQDVYGTHLAPGLINDILAVLLLLKVRRIEIALLSVLLHVVLRLPGVFLLLW